MKLRRLTSLCLVCLALTLASAPANADVHRDLSYGKASDGSPARRLDIYVPSTPSGRPQPVFVYVHGGGWTGGDKARVGDKPEWLNRKGFILVSVEYRKMPAGRHPAAAEDLASALAWIDINIADFGGDPDAVFLIGHSTGGHLVSLVATDSRFLARHQLGPERIKGVICLDTMGFDLEALVRLLPSEASRRYRDVFGDDTEALRDGSPAHHVGAGSQPPPFLLLVARGGSANQHLNRLFARRLAEAGADVALEVFPSESHNSINSGLGGAKHSPTRTVESFAYRLLGLPPHSAAK